MSASQWEKIIRLQNLFKTYSGLGFTRASDRAVAADGIQSSLLRALGTRGGYGIFSEDAADVNNKDHRGLLRRGLLWYRPADKQALAPIQFPPGREVPSWSWMAYMGEIDFLRLTFGAIDWMDLRSPW